jgi:hypothetical protein
MVVSQEGRTALIWAAMKGHTKIFKALIAKGADKDAKEKVRRRHSVSTGERANDQRMCGTGLRDLALQGVSVPCTVPVVFVTGTN